MKRRLNAPPQPGTKNNLIIALIAVSWICGGALLKHNEPWLYLPVIISVLTALWVGRRQGWLLRTLALLVLVIPISKLVKKSPPNADTHRGAPMTITASIEKRDTAVIRALVASEETYLNLDRKMDTLSKGLLDLRLPGPAVGAERLFSKSVTTVDLVPAPEATAIDTSEFKAHSWPLAAITKQTDSVKLWRPMLDNISYFEHAKVKIVSGEHPDGDMWKYDAKGSFEALAHMKSDKWHSFEGRMDLTWERLKTGNDGAGEWQITGWKTTKMNWRASPTRLFAEALDSVMREPQESSMLRRSLHYEATVKHYREGTKQLPHPYFAPISANQKEGIAVADVNGDGFDDIYITMRLGKNKLLINQHDGTFLEQAALFKLDLPGHTPCALFADFDNDGDQDVILGRSLLKTSYLENRQGIFYQHPIPKFMPMAVLSMSAADYNMDGLLDVYICTYRPAAPAGASPAGGVAQSKDGEFDWPDEFFDINLAREYRRRESEHRKRKGGIVLDQLGPPNVLLVNRGGGKFEPSPENETVGIWRNSMQATWGDYNQDGRPDLYIANDWGLDVLFRNDAVGGFTDVTIESGLTSYGYAMGASWGDYNNDGYDDLYVSNMYSDPGRRITKQIPGLEKMFIESAAGNWLYHRVADGKYKQIAGITPPAMTVMNAGWSWGGCFADFNNDRFLDLYVLNGYFTAPKEHASGLDLESNLWRTMVRTDENLSRPSFRFSPEWKRTPAPDNDGPMIDARLAGVERKGDQVLVHSLNGNERNRYFTNRAGQSFTDISALSGLDNLADSRGFSILDYDRDGWQDIALVNANLPLFNLYRNEMGAAGFIGGVIAIRFVGGNQQAAPSNEFGCRDGYGARVVANLGNGNISREHRCGDGWSTQNSSTMIIGIGSHTNVVSLAVNWPSGRTTTTRDIPEGTLLTVYENPEDSPANVPVERSTYRVKSGERKVAPVNPEVFPIAAVDRSAKPGARLRVYTTFSTSSQVYKDNLQRLKHVRAILAPEGVDFIAVTIDDTDDDQKLAEYNREYQPSTRLIRIAVSQRATAAAAFAKVFSTKPPMPSSVVTDNSGRVLATLPGVPSISELRKIPQRNP
ncbi:MAG: CRTAC1 family protein [Nitrospinaceae bacterium]|nr:CRTAC1 family protein [Nitrospinaceae bacterium]